MTSSELNVREKQQVDAGPAESTSDVARFVPAVDIWETDANLTLVADLPGVAQEGLNLDLKDNILTISARVIPEAADRKMISREYEVGGFYRQFSLSEKIDQSNISATLKDGVLTLILPKVTPARPRKIEVSAE